MTFYKNRRDDTCAFVCDQCGEEQEMDVSDFFDALGEFKDHGWRARQDCGEWMHFCPDCL